MGNKKLYTSIPAAQFGIGGDRVTTKRIEIDPNDQAPNTTVVLKGNSATATNITLTLPSTTGTIALDASPSVDSFKTIQTPLGTSPVATSPTDTLTLSSTGNDLSITGNSTTDTVNFDLKTTGVSAATYTCPTIAVDSKGRITTAVSAPFFDTSYYRIPNSSRRPSNRNVYYGPYATSVPYEEGSPADSDRQYYYPVTISRKFTLHSLLMVCTRGDSSKNCSFAFYSDYNGLPGTLLEESSSFSCTASGSKIYTTSATQYPAGRYWVACQMNSATPTGAFSMLMANAINCSGYIGSTSALLSPDGINISHVYTDSYAFDSWQSSLNSDAFESGYDLMPAVFFCILEYGNAY